MRVLICTPLIGGVGGVERLVFELCAALRDDHVDVVYDVHLGGRLAELPPGVVARNRRSLRFRGSNRHGGLSGVVTARVVDPIRRRFSAPYDIAILLARGPEVERVTRAGVRVVNLCGEAFRPGRAVDVVWSEAPDSSRPAWHPGRVAMFAPPVQGITSAPERVEGLPEQFLLTVFNPWGPVKGADVLEEIVDALPMPLVWCHSTATVSFEVREVLRGHPNVVHLDDPTPGQLRDLYERAWAYVCFSRAESFGWAIADALVHARAVVSRPVGVLSHLCEPDPSVFLVDDVRQFDWSRLDGLDGLGHRVPSRDVSFMSPSRFRAELLRVCDPDPGSRSAATAVDPTA